MDDRQPPERKLKVPSLVDALYEAVRESVLTGELAGGSPVTEKQLSTEYEVARPTAKAVIERLTHDGLLRRDANKTARTPLMTVADIRDVYYSRGFLEREVVTALARRRKDRVPIDAHRHNDELRAAAAESSLMALVAADIAFHRSLVDDLGSRRLSRMYSLLSGEVHLCMAQVQAHHLLDATIILEEHAGILEAIEAGDARQASRRLDAHLKRACDQLVAYRKQEKEPITPP
jgi:DNA-binding GntR family transcriptional regulator